jgi:hypothetical protein
MQRDVGECDRGGVSGASGSVGLAARGQQTASGRRPQRNCWISLRVLSPGGRRRAAHASSAPPPPSHVHMNENRISQPQPARCTLLNGACSNRTRGASACERLLRQPAGRSNRTGCSISHYRWTTSLLPRSLLQDGLLLHIAPLALCCLVRMSKVNVKRLSLMYTKHTLSRPKIAMHLL